jgi:hypothetical protein
MRTLLKLLGLLVLIAVLGMGTIVGAGLYMNQRAEDAARTFCASIPERTTATAIRRLADEAGARLQTRADDADRTSISAVFPGWVFNAWRCDVEIGPDGRVTQTRVIEEADP